MNEFCLSQYENKNIPATGGKIPVCLDTETVFRDALQSGVASFFPVFRFPLSSCNHQSSVISHQSSVPGGRGVRKEDHPTHEMTTHFSRSALIAGGSPALQSGVAALFPAFRFPLSAFRFPPSTWSLTLFPNTGFIPNRLPTIRYCPVDQYFTIKNSCSKAAKIR